MWCIPEVTPEFEERMFDVLDEYAKPYDPKNPKLCIDEKSHQLLGVSRKSKQAKPGKISREDYEYKRNGTVNHFICVEPQTGERRIRTTKRRCKTDFAKFIKFIVMNTYKDANKISIVLDNLNTHKNESIIKQYGKKEGQEIINRIEWHYTPKHASWLNMAEIEIGVLSKVLKKKMPEIETVKKEIRAYQNRRNKSKAKINWKFTKEDAKKKFKLHQN